MQNIRIMFVCLFMFGCMLSACSSPADKADDAFSENKPDEVAVEDDEAERNLSDSNDEQTTEEDSAMDIDINNDDSITVLVNKQHGLSEDYEPDDLVTVDVPTVLDNPEVNQLRKEAADALKRMFDAAKQEGIYLYARSGYRSYQTQVNLFENYARQHGEEKANKFSAKPGHSEHQTGLSMDVTSESVNFQLTESFGETKEGIWLKENAHKFGFIIRYPKDKEHITGYIYEPWHIRYLGVDLATEITEMGLTYEEYLVEKGLIHEVYSQDKK